MKRVPKGGSAEKHTLQLTHYRSYAEASFALGQHTVFLGPNGSGKTNVIEALRTLSVTKSYRVTHDRDVITWGENYCRVVLTQPEDTFAYVLTKESFGTKKIVQHNGVAIPLTQVYGLLPTVLFSPETMQLIDGAPQERRRFLDTLLSQADPHYIDALVVYRKVMRERHYVLLRLQQGLGSSDELEFWDSELVRTGTYLIEQRIALLDQLNELLATIYPIFLDATHEETLTLHYKSGVSVEQFAQRLASQRTYDIKTATTNSGPHRDDVTFVLRDRDITLFASRGELRRSVLAIKLAEAHYLNKAKQKEPTVLLDDVFSELDAFRRERFLAAITNYRTVITTTDESFIDAHPLAAREIHRLG